MVKTMSEGPQRSGRERVLHEARGLYLAKGYTETSMQQIADAAGVTKAALYYHFQDKEDLFVEVMLAEMHRLQAGITGVVGGEQAFVEQLTAIARYVFSLFHGDFGRLMQAFHTHISCEKHDDVVSQVPLPHEVLRPVFERAAAAGEIRPQVNVDLAVRLYFSMVLGEMKSPVGERWTLPPEIDIAAAIAEVIVNGIGSGSRRPAAASGRPQSQL